MEQKRLTSVLEFDDSANQETSYTMDDQPGFLNLQWKAGASLALNTDGQAKPPVVLVDDVLTTGATFRVCRKVLEEAGHEVLGGVWLALA